VEELSFSWDRRLGGTQNWYGHFEKKGEKSLYCCVCNTIEFTRALQVGVFVKSDTKIVLEVFDALQIFISFLLFSTPVDFYLLIWLPVKMFGSLRGSASFPKV
jgi:hypothetical protein